MVLPQTLLRAGDHFLTFRVLRLLARGGAAEVYEIEHQSKSFALKVIPGLSLNRRLLERHEQEWRVLEWMVGNANVVTVHDWESAQGRSKRYAGASRGGGRRHREVFRSLCAVGPASTSGSRLTDASVGN